MTNATDALRALETWLGTFADDIPAEAYHRLCAIQRSLATPAGSASGEDAWIPVGERLPKPLQPVLLAIRDSGRAHVLRACYAAPNTLELGWESECWEGCTEDEETGATYCPEGWYEWNRHEETHWHVTEEIIGWQPLPAIQGSANGQG